MAELYSDMVKHNDLSNGQSGLERAANIVIAYQQSTLDIMLSMAADDKQSLGKLITQVGRQNPSLVAAMVQEAETQFANDDSKGGYTLLQNVIPPVISASLNELDDPVTALNILKDLAQPGMDKNDWARAAVSFLLQSPTVTDDQTHTFFDEVTSATNTDAAAIARNLLDKASFDDITDPVALSVVLGSKLPKDAEPYIAAIMLSDDEAKKTLLITALEQMDRGIVSNILSAVAENNTETVADIVNRVLSAGGDDQQELVADWLVNMNGVDGVYKASVLLSLNDITQSTSASEALIEKLLARDNNIFTADNASSATEIMVAAYIQLGAPQGNDADSEYLAKSDIYFNDMADLLKQHASISQSRDIFLAGLPEHAIKMFEFTEDKRVSEIVAGMHPESIANFITPELIDYKQLVDWISAASTDEQRLKLLNYADPRSSVDAVNYLLDQQSPLIDRLLPQLDWRAFSMMLLSLNSTDALGLVQTIYTRIPQAKALVTKSLPALNPDHAAGIFAKWLKTDSNTAKEAFDQVFTSDSPNSSLVTDNEWSELINTFAANLLATLDLTDATELFTHLVGDHLSAAAATASILIENHSIRGEDLLNSVLSSGPVDNYDLLFLMDETAAAAYIEWRGADPRSATEEMLYSMSLVNPQETTNIVVAMDSVKVIDISRNGFSWDAVLNQSFMINIWTLLSTADKARLFFAMSDTERSQLPSSNTLEHLQTLSATEFETHTIDQSNLNALVGNTDQVGLSFIAGGSSGQLANVLQTNDFNVLEIKAGLKRDDFQDDGRYLAYIESVFIPEVETALEHTGQLESLGKLSAADAHTVVKDLIMAAARAGLEFGDKHLSLTLDLGLPQQNGGDNKANFYLSMSGKNAASTANSEWNLLTPVISQHEFVRLSENSLDGTVLEATLGVEGVGIKHYLTDADKAILAQQRANVGLVDQKASVTMSRDENVLFNKDNIVFVNIGESGSQDAPSGGDDKTTVISLDKTLGDFNNETEWEQYYNDYANYFNDYLIGLGFNTDEIINILDGFKVAAKANKDNKIALVIRNGSLIGDWTNADGTAQEGKAHLVAAAQRKEYSVPMAAYAVLAKDFGDDLDLAIQRTLAVVDHAEFRTGAMIGEDLDDDDFINGNKEFKTVIAKNLGFATRFSADNALMDWVSNVLQNESLTKAEQTFKSYLGSYGEAYQHFLNDGASHQEAFFTALNTKGDDVLLALENAILMMPNPDLYSIASSEQTWVAFLLMAFGTAETQSEVQAIMGRSDNPDDWDLSYEHAGTIYPVDEELFDEGTLRQFQQNILDQGIADGRKLQAPAAVVTNLTSGFQNITDLKNGTADPAVFEERRKTLTDNALLFLAKATGAYSLMDEWLFTGLGKIYTLGEKHPPKINATGDAYTQTVDGTYTGGFGARAVKERTIEVDGEEQTVVRISGIALRTAWISSSKYAFTPNEGNGIIGYPLKKMIDLFGPFYSTDENGRKTPLSSEHSIPAGAGQYDPIGLFTPAHLGPYVERNTDTGEWSWGWEGDISTYWLIEYLMTKFQNPQGTNTWQLGSLAGIAGKFNELNGFGVAAHLFMQSVMMPFAIPKLAYQTAGLGVYKLYADGDRPYSPNTIEGHDRARRHMRGLLTAGFQLGELATIGGTLSAAQFLYGGGNSPGVGPRLSYATDLIGRGLYSAGYGLANLLSSTVPILGSAATGFMQKFTNNPAAAMTVLIAAINAHRGLHGMDLFAAEQGEADPNGQGVLMSILNGDDQPANVATQENFAGFQDALSKMDPTAVIDNLKASGSMPVLPTGQKTVADLQALTEEQWDIAGTLRFTIDELNNQRVEYVFGGTDSWIFSALKALNPAPAFLNGAQGFGFFSFSKIITATNSWSGGAIQSVVDQLETWKKQTTITFPGAQYNGASSVWSLPRSSCLL
ncbi:MAG: hypothetical protein AAFZ92_05940 [Pseudomonadota bacterium]